jgi:CheY-like chemotaxis protein
MKKKSILIVEDEHEMAYVISRTVERLGFVVAGCEETGEKAVSAAGELRPDLVLMDINLAGKMDGIEAAGRINRMFQIPIVYVTALTDEKTLQRVARGAPSGYIVKPFRDDELRTVIDIALGTLNSR